jgi:DNA-directed RNA polymerase specialized sigma subunit
MTKQDLLNYQHIKSERAQIDLLLMINRQQQAAGENTQRLIEQYTQKQEELAAMQLRIEEAIESLDPVERTIIRMRYIKGDSWTKIGFAIHYSRSSTFEIHKRALEKLRDK